MSKLTRKPIIVIITKAYEEIKLHHKAFDELRKDYHIFVMSASEGQKEGVKMLKYSKLTQKEKSALLRIYENLMQSN